MSLNWAPDPAPMATFVCHVCHARAAMPLVVSVPNTWHHDSRLDFHRCPHCLSLSAPEGHFVEFTEADPDITLAWRHYVQLGAGIDAMAQPVERLVRPAGQRASLLDVGCGFGYVVDFWHHAEQAEAAGAEPSPFGRRGHALLTPDIHVGMLAEVPALDGRRFDLVLSSEVIEHVPDPAAFIAELKARLTAGGTLVLTTPSADFVLPGSGLAAVLGVLSPGLHKSILSRTALHALLTQAGFGHVVVEIANERLLAWASDRPIALLDGGHAQSARVTEYLVRRAAEPGLQTDLALGFAYRGLRELVNLGRIAEAAPMLAAFREATLAQFGLDITDAAAVRRAVLPVTDMAGYERAAPFSLGPALYFSAMGAVQGQPDHPAAVERFGLAFDVMAHTLRMAPEYFQEAERLVWPARYEQGNSAIQSGRAAEGLAWLAPLLPGEAQAAARLCTAPVPPTFQLRALAESGLAQLASGDTRAAAALAAAYIAHPDATPERTRTLAGAFIAETVKHAAAADAVPAPAPQPSSPGRLLRLRRRYTGS